MLLTTVILMDILSGAEIDLFIPGFPEIKSYFSISTLALEATLSLNCIGFCISLFFVGTLADKYGRKSLIIIGTVVFILSSITCLTANSYDLFLVGRFFQGVGIAAPAVLCFVIVTDHFDLKYQQYYMGVLNGLMNIVVAGAPVIGGYITKYFHWKGNFITLLVLALLVLIMTCLFVPSFKATIKNEDSIWRGYFSIFKSKPMILLLLHTTLVFVPYWIFIGISPILYINDLGVSIENYGYYQGAWAFAYALGSILFGMVIHKYKTEKMLYFSMAILLISFVTILYTALLDVRDPLIIALGLLVFGIGSIVPGVILYPIAVNFINQAKAKTSSLIKASMLMLTALGLEFVGYLYQGSYKNVGLVIAGFILFATVTLFLVIKNNSIRKFF